MSSVTTEQPPSEGSVFRCQECSKTFKRAVILRDHIRGHRDEKPFQCGVCKKGFTRKSDMKRHEDTHAGSQFGCSVCGKRFTRQLALTKHVKINHDGNSSRREDSSILPLSEPTQCGDTTVVPPEGDPSPTTQVTAMTQDWYDIGQWALLDSLLADGLEVSVASATLNDTSAGSSFSCSDSAIWSDLGHTTAPTKLTSLPDSYTATELEVDKFSPPRSIDFEARARRGRSRPSNSRPCTFPCLQHTFRSMEKLRQHIWAAHSTTLSEAMRLAMVGRTGLWYTCYLHGGDTRAELIQHCQIEHGIVVDGTQSLPRLPASVQSVVLREEYREEINDDYYSSDDEEILYNCKSCAAEYETRSAFTRHLISHLESIHRKPYRCHRCDVSFALERDYVSHRNERPHIRITSRHFDPEIFCPFKCEMTFESPAARDEHVRKSDGCKKRVEQEDKVWKAVMRQLGALSAQLNLQEEFQRIAKPGLPRELAIGMVLASVPKWVD